MPSDFPANADPPWCDRRQWPVFVLGAERSGTSALGRSLRKTERYEGHGEGHLIALLPRLIGTTTAHFSRNKRHAEPGQFTMLASLKPKTVEHGLQTLFAQIARETYPTGHWMEKTPGRAMIRAAPLLRRVWPNARFIFMKRRGIENVQSRRRKWPEAPFEAQCLGWTEAMTAWESVRKGLAGVSIELDQRDLAIDPRGSVERVAALLDLTTTEAARMLRAVQTDRPQQTGARIDTVENLASLDWTDAQRAIFESVCGEVMRRFGYTNDARYAGA